MALPLSEAIALFRSFDAGTLPRRDLEQSLADRVMQPLSRLADPTRPPHTEEESLAHELASIVCGATGPDEDVALFVRRVLECLTQISDPDEVFDLLPLIRFQDEFAVLVSKHRRGIISPAGIQSVIAKRFRWDEVRAALAGADADQLQAICEYLEHGEYRRIRDSLLLS